MKKWPFLIVAGCVGLGGGARAGTDGLPPNLGHELQTLTRWERAQPAGRSDGERQQAMAAHVDASARRLQRDAAGRVTVNVLLDGSRPPAEVRAGLVALGATVIGENVARRADRADGVLSARLPVEHAAEAAGVAGVRSVVAAHRPWRRAGKVAGQGLPALHADAVLADGIDGSGVTVGVLSDSYDLTSPHAKADVASGDLPNKVVVVAEGDPNDPTNTDEGRAMLQIVHDVAPGAALAFSTVGETQTTFAAAIRTLRTGSAVQCNVLVDDIGFSDEPFFSDGIISQAVDDVVTSTTLAGHPVIFYSASGNDGTSGYAATFTPVTDEDARAGLTGKNNLKLSDVPAVLTAGGFHNFKAADVGRGSQIVQKVEVSAESVEISFQWDDPFDHVTTDYNLLVFDADGNYLADVSGTDNNLSTGEPLEVVDLDPNTDGSAATYQLVIARASGTAATRLQYVADGGTFSGKFLHSHGVSTLFGHSAAANADAVAAYDVHDLSVPEDYNSFGPVIILFDEAGNRLAQPVVRDQPTIAAVDGVDTTFFPAGPLSETDSDGDGYPNFYGSSAAAPHAAGVAALLLSAAGGPTALTASAMRSLLESTAGNHDLDPAFSGATFASADGQFTVTLTAAGDDGPVSGADPEFFTLSFTGPAGSSLKKVKIDVGPANARFDLGTSGNGGPFKIGDAVGVAKTAITAKVTPATTSQIGTKLVLQATPGAFGPGATLRFGVGREDASFAANYSADKLAGATVSAVLTLADGTVERPAGVLANQTGHGYSPDVGYGLINAQAALEMLPGR